MNKEFEELNSDVEQYYLLHKNNSKASFHILSSPFQYNPDHFIIGNFPEDGRINLNGDHIQLTNDDVINETIETLFKNTVKTSYSFFSRVDTKRLLRNSNEFDYLCRK